MREYDKKSKLSLLVLYGFNSHPELGGNAGEGSSLMHPLIVGRPLMLRCRSGSG